MVEALKEAQRVKQEIFSLGEGDSLEMPLNQAAVAFGISKEWFLEMIRKGKSLKIEPHGGSVKVELIASAGEPQKQCWDKVIAAYKREKGEYRQTLNAYLALYCQIQIGLGVDLEDDTGLFHLALYALWDKLPDSEQKVLNFMKPSAVRSSVGIVKSGE